MRTPTTITAALTALLLFGLGPSVLGAGHHPPQQHGHAHPHPPAHRHALRRLNLEDSHEHEHERDLADWSERADAHLSKRHTYSGTATFYSAGRNACGGSSTSSDFIVALNAPQYGDLDSISSWCFQQIAITYKGKTEVATIVDACPSCATGSLDMSKSLFESFADPELGTFQMSWQPLGEESQSSSESSSQESSTSTRSSSSSSSSTEHSSHTTPTSTYSPPPTTHILPTSTSSRTRSSKPTPPQPSTITQYVSIKTVVPTQSSTPGNLNGLNMLYNGMVAMAAAGRD